MRPLVGLVVAVLVAGGVSAGVWFLSSLPPAPSLPPEGETAEPPGWVTLLGAGDIATCGSDDDERVARLLDQREGIIATLGDNAYSSGTPEQFDECYDPTWGRHRERTRPAIGNHDHRTPEAAGYFRYFGELAGPSGRGYYAYDLGPHWRAIVLDSNCDHVAGGCDEGSPQERWLRGELAAHPDKNVVAYMHHPRFSSGYHTGTKKVAAFWDALFEAGADIVLAAHDHSYERFAPQAPDGNRDDDRGIRQFIVGTGGGRLRPFTDTPLPTTEVRDDRSHGLLVLQLGAESYTWEFLPALGDSFTDAGSASVVN